MSGAVATDTHEETKSEFLNPPISNRVFFEATLGPNADEIKILSKDLGLSEAQISDAQSK